MNVPESCPKCGHKPVTTIVYGLIRDVSKELQQGIDAGELQLGGCMIGAGAPAWLCRGCGHTVSCEEASHPIMPLINKV